MPNPRDLVKRLRECGAKRAQSGLHVKNPNRYLCDDAADEIERLHKELREIAKKRISDITTGREKP